MGENTCIPGLEKISEELKVIAVPYRLQIICLLAKQKSLCVCDIVKSLKIKQNLVSHHLAMLKRIHLVMSKREGTNQRYSLNQETYQHIKDQLKLIFNI